MLLDMNNQRTELLEIKTIIHKVKNTIKGLEVKFEKISQKNITKIMGHGKQVKIRNQEDLSEKSNISIAGVTESTNRVNRREELLKK